MAVFAQFPAVFAQFALILPALPAVLAQFTWPRAAATVGPQFAAVTVHLSPVLSDLATVLPQLRVAVTR